MCKRGHRASGKKKKEEEEEERNRENIQNTEQDKSLGTNLKKVEIDNLPERAENSDY